MINGQKSETLVDVIDGGRIIRVTEEHARREGLPIIRRQVMDLQQFSAEKARTQTMSAREKKGLLRFEEFRRPLKGDTGIVNELKHNFHWDVMAARKARGLTRKQLAESLGVDEHEIKMLENGVLVKEDYVLINKVQSFFNVVLRKDGRNDNISPLKQALDSKRIDTRREEVRREEVRREEKKAEENKGSTDEVLSGEDIELDEI